MQTFFVEHIETPTGRMRIVTDSDQCLRAADWDDLELRHARNFFSGTMAPVQSSCANLYGHQRLRGRLSPISRAT